jgi:hypothetical protein
VVPAHEIGETGHTDIIASVDVGEKSTTEEKSIIENAKKV